MPWRHPRGPELRLEDIHAAVPRAYLRDLAVNALDSVTSKPTWLAEAWDQSPGGPKWRRTISDLLNILDPSQEETLFPL